MVAGVPTNAASLFGFGCLCDVPVHGASGVTGWRTVLINVRMKARPSQKGVSDGCK
jgi:hypothetical protein